MKQKVALAGALIHEPQLLMLDEPLTGLDAGAARQVKDLLGARPPGATIILTTHILEVAERLADRIGIIARGRLIAEGTLDELRGGVGAGGATLETLFLDLTSEAGGRIAARRVRGFVARFPPRSARSHVDVRRSRAGTRRHRRGPFAASIARLARGGLVRRIESGPRRGEITAILSTAPADDSLGGRQSMTDRPVRSSASDLDLIFSSPVAARSRSPRAPVDRDRGDRLRGADAPAVRRRGRAQGRRALARALSRLVRGWPHGDRPRRHSGDGPLLMVGLRRARVLVRSPRRRLARLSCLGRRLSRCCPTGCARQSSRRSSRLPVASTRCMASYGRRSARRRATPRQFLAGPLSAARSSRSLALSSANASRRRRSSLRARRRTGASPASRATRFGVNVGATLRIKERRVVWRDPWLMSQLLLQAAYTMPVAVIFWRSGGPTGTVAIAFTPALVVIAAQLAGALSWIALSAEDAPDFPRPLRSREARSSAPRSPPSASRSPSFSPCPLLRWLSLRPGPGFARSCSAPERSPRRRWSIFGDKLRLAAASCSAVIRNRSSSA